MGSCADREAAEKLARKTKRCTVWPTDVQSSPEPVLRVGVKGAERGAWAKPPEDTPARKRLLWQCARLAEVPDGTAARELGIPRKTAHRIARYVRQGWAPYHRTLRIEVVQRNVELVLESGRLVVRVTA